MDDRKKCSLCGLVLSCVSALSRHKLNIHRDIRFTCEICGKTYSRQDTVKNHVCKQKKTIKCDYCGLSFKYLSYKKRHNCRKVSSRFSRFFPDFLLYFMLVHPKLIIVCRFLGNTFYKERFE